MIQALNQKMEQMEKYAVASKTFYESKIGELEAQLKQHKDVSLHATANFNQTDMNAFAKRVGANEDLLMNASESLKNLVIKKKA